MIDTIVGLVVRHGLTIFGGYLFNQGLIDKDGVEQMISALIALLGIALSIGHKIIMAREKAAAAANAKTVTPVRIDRFGNPVALLVLCLGVLWTATGCLNYMATQAHNSACEQHQALKVAAGPNGGVFAGIDLLDVPGWLGAWKASPGLMTAATAGDILSGLAGYTALQQATKSSGGDTSITINGDDNNVTTSGGNSKPRNQRTTTISGQ